MDILPSEEVAQPELLPSEKTNEVFKVSSEAAAERASKYSLALGNSLKPDDVQVLHDRILAGEDRSIRENAALTKDIKLREERFKMISEMSDAAAREGRKLSKPEEDVILALTDDEVVNVRTNPDTFIEKEYAKRVLDMANSYNGEVLFDKVAEEDEDGAYFTEDSFVEVVAGKEIFQRLADEQNQRAAKQSWGGFGIDMITGMVPFYSWYQLNSALSEVKEGLPWLAGNNLAEKVQAIQGLPLEERETVARRAIEELNGDNTLLATQFANALVRYSASSKVIDNIFVSGIDLLGVGAVAVKPAIAGAKAVAGSSKFMTSKEALKESYRKLARETAKPGAEASEVADAAGDTMTAARLSLTRKNLIEKLDARSRNPALPADEIKSLMDVIPGMLNFSELLGGLRTSTSAEVIRRIQNRLDTATDKVLESLFFNPVNMTEQGQNALKAGLDEQVERFRTLYRAPEDMILQVSTTEPGEVLGGGIFAKIKFGLPDGRPFNSMEQADIYVENYLNIGSTPYKLVPEGNGWVVEVLRPVDFSSDRVRNALQIDRQSDYKMLGDTLGKVLSSVRSGADTLPKDVYTSMLGGVLGGARFAELLTEIARPLGKIKDKKAFSDFLRSQATAVDPMYPGQKGKFNSTVGEYEVEWAAKFDRLPTNEEVEAYFTYKKLNDVHYVAKNLGLYADKIRLGLANYQIKNVPGAFEGKLLSAAEIKPGTVGDPGTVISYGVGKEKVKRFSTGSGKELDEVKDLIKNNDAVVIQLSPDGGQKFGMLEELQKILGRSTADYVVVPRNWLEETPLNLRQIPFRPGMHHMYAIEGKVISQPKTFRSADGKVVKYFGDVNAYMVNKNANGENILSAYEAGRKLLVQYNNIKAGRRNSQIEAMEVRRQRLNERFLAAQAKGDVAVTALKKRIKAEDKKIAAARKDAMKPESQLFQEMRDYVEKNLGIPFKQFMQDFGPKGRLDPDVPLMIRNMNSSLSDSYDLAKMLKNDDADSFNFIKASESQYNLYNNSVNLKFTQERGEIMKEFVELGDQELPLYGLQGSELLDPMTTLDRSLNTITRGLNFEAAKHDAAEKYIAAFGPALDRTQDIQRRDPIMAMMYAPFKEGADPDMVQAAAAYRARVQQFFGLYKTIDQRKMEYWSKKMLTGIDPDTGKYSHMAMHKILNMTDPTQKIKAIAFHASMGFMNIKQLFLNANTASHVIGLAGPVRGSKATAAALIQSVALRGDKDLDGVAGKAMRALGFTDEDYVEATEAMRRAGWDKVGKENAYREHHMNGNVIQTNVGKYLDYGLLPMKEGDLFARRAGWNAAYFKWREANPGKKLKDSDISNLLYDADKYTVNMTQAANSAVQEGVAGIATQFWTYQLRLMEQFMGKRLTMQEKTRLFTTYSALYGVPVAAGATLGFMPVHESMRKWYLDKGINVDDSTLHKLVNDGALSYLTEIVAGEKTNINTAYGPSGIPFFYDIWEGETGVIDALTGASGSVIARFAEDILPVFPWIMDAINPNTNAITPTGRDFWDVIGNVSTLSNAEKAYFALGWGKYFDKYGAEIADNKGVIRPIMYALTGLTADKIEDYYALRSNDIQYRIWQNKQRKKVMEDLRSGIISDSPEERAMYMSRAKVRSAGADFDPTQLSRMAIEVFGENKSLLENQISRTRNLSSEERERIKMLNRKLLGAKE